MPAIKFRNLTAREIKDLYLKITPYVISKTQYLVQDQERAKDIVQDSFVKLLDRNQEFPSLVALYQWLYRTCHNAGIDYLRSAHRKTMEESFDESALLCAESSPEARTLNAAYVAKFLNCLGKKDAQIFCYRYVDELNLVEIADLLGISEKTVARTLTRAHSRLTEKNSLVRRMLLEA